MIVFLILFVTIPLVELYFLIQVGAEFGAIPTIGLSLFTAALGGFLVRRQGFAVLARLRQASDRGETPALEMFDGVLLLAAGLLLLLPGFLTDAVGFLLLVPALRQFLIRRVLVTLPQGPTPGTRVIEGDYRRERD